MKRATLLVLLTAVAAPALASSDLESLVRQQAEQIERLTAAVAVLTERLDAVQGKVQITEEQLTSTADFVEQMAENRRGGDERTSIGGYGELHYNNIQADDPANDNDEIDFHRFVMFFNHEFTDRIRFFSELEIEHGLVQDTADGSNGGEVEIEQAFIEMDLTDALRAKAGLFIVPVGILNETHEPPTFYGVERNDVENIILPSTWWEAGAGLQGYYDNGLSWDLAVHSGLKMPTTGSSAFRVRSGRQKVSNASADDLAYTARVRYTGMPGLDLAATYQHQSDASQQSGDGLDSGNLVSVQGIFNRGPFQLRALWAQWQFDGNLVKAMDVDEQTGWYVEPSFKIPFGDHAIGFYGRWEDVEGARTRDRFDQWEVGMNYWPTANVVFKVDYRNRTHDLAVDAGRDFKAFDLGVGYNF